MNFQEHPFKIFIRYISRHRDLFYIDMACALLVAGIDLVFP